MTHRHGPACGCAGARVRSRNPIADLVFRLTNVRRARQVRQDAAPRRRAPRYPDQIDARIRAVLVGRVAVLRRIVDDAFAPVLARLADAATRQDADDEAQLIRVVDQVRKTWGAQAPDARPALDRAGAQLDLFARDELADLVPTVFRIPVTNLPAQPAVVAEWRDKAWKFVEQADDAAVDRVATAVRNAVGRGVTTARLTAELERALGVAESRARLIARSETAKLNRQVSQARQTSIGVDRYEWSTSGDDVVRPSHRAKDGAIFRWDDPPSDTGHPGDDPNCRCVAIPVLDDLDEAAFGEDYAARRRTPTPTTIDDEGIVRPVDPEAVVVTPGFGPSNARRWKRNDVPGQLRGEDLRAAERARQAATMAAIARGQPVPQGALGFPEAATAPRPSAAGVDPLVTRAVIGAMEADGLRAPDARALLSVLYRMKPDAKAAAVLVARGLLRREPMTPEGFALTTEGIAVVERARHAVVTDTARARRPPGG